MNESSHLNLCASALHPATKHVVYGEIWTACVTDMQDIHDVIETQFL